LHADTTLDNVTIAAVRNTTKNIASKKTQYCDVINDVTFLEVW